LKINLDLPANKLQKGHGDGVCMVLEKLCQISLQNKFRFKKAVIKDDGGALVEDAEDDGGDDMGGDDMGGDLQDMANQEQSDDEDIGDFAEPEGLAPEDLEDKAIIHSNITREEWLIGISLLLP
jgi:hypothetical protein